MEPAKSNITDEGWGQLAAWVNKNCPGADADELVALVEAEVDRHVEMSEGDEETGP